MAEYKLIELIQRVEQDKLVVPEFQRGFTWRSPDIRRLLESLLLDFPIGAALFWKTQRGTLEFRHIEDVEFADDDGDAGPEAPRAAELTTEEIEFILDGQQRITSIYKLFPSSLAPSPHELASRFKGLRFFLALRDLGMPITLDALATTDFAVYQDPDTVAAAIVEKRHADLRKECRHLGTETVPQRLSEEDILQVCEKRLWLPLTRAFLENRQSHLQRLRRVVEASLQNQLEDYAGNRSRASLSADIRNGMDRWVDWFTSTFQATLNSKTLTCLVQGNEKPEGLARIFETINTTGMTLSVFDLLVARLGTWTSESGEKTNLRSLVLTEVDKQYLQGFDDTRSLGGPASQQLPRLLALRAGIELKKGEILRASRDVFLKEVPEAGPGLSCALATLRDEMGVVDASYLPFRDAIAMLGAAHSQNWEEVKGRVIAFLWAVCITEDWDSGTNDKTRAAFRQLRHIVDGRNAGAGVLSRLEEQFPSFEDVRDATSKSSMLFRTLMAFNLSRGGADWVGQARLTARSLEDHHLFPKDWLSNNRAAEEDKPLWASLRDSVLNRLLVSTEANGSARAQTPPAYLGSLGPAQRRVLQIPESFMGPLSTPIRADDFTEYLCKRYALMREDYLALVRSELS